MQSRISPVRLAGGLLTIGLIAGCGSSKTAATVTTTTAKAGTTVAAAATTVAAAATTAVAATAAKPAAPAAMDLSTMTGTLNASGATFPKAFYDEAIAAFKTKAKGITINYGGGGSGKGRQDLADQVTDWAGSDGTVAEADKAKYKGGEFLYFPTVVAPITLSYNLDGVDKLQLSAGTVAKIYQREIKSWDDAAIAADNPGVKLPATPIVAAHRSDSSGTTSNFTSFLDKAVGTGGDGSWKLKAGSTVEWPADTQGGDGNGGVAKIVKDTKGAIGYVDLSDAKAAGLKFATVKNKAGKFVAPTLEATSAAAAGATIKPDLTFSLAWADGDAAYPIAAQTWIIVYKKQADKTKGEATKAFIQYVLTDGQTLAPKLDFGPLPKDLAAKAIAQLDQIQLG
jgi:phosphate transport system substrate-binding protein